MIVFYSVRVGSSHCDVLFNPRHCRALNISPTERSPQRTFRVDHSVPNNQNGEEVGLNFDIETLRLKGAGGALVKGFQSTS